MCLCLCVTLVHKSCVCDVPVCVFDVSKQERVEKGIETEGSNLSGVSAKCVWDDLSRPPEDEDDSRSICIGSQPRRLSDKGASLQPPTALTSTTTVLVLWPCLFSPL